jgi:membrane associated rhomboid family serine protease
MGLADRDYHRNTPPGGGGILPALTPVVKWLLILNIGIFLLDYVILAPSKGIGGDDFPPILRWGAFTIRSAILEFRIWEFISFQFLHGSVGHVLFNSLGLYFFGPWMERWWGSRKFLIFYLICGAGGAVFLTLLATLGIVPGGFDTPMVGASAGIYGILIGVAVIAPDLRARLLFPPIELSMRQLAIGMIAISAGIILLSIGGNQGGEAGHLGGAMVGFLLMRMPRLLGGAGETNIIRPRAFRKPNVAKLRPRSQAHVDDDSELNRILDKILREGTNSLTESEQAFLVKASERQKP